MTEFENVRKALEELEAINNPQSESPRTIESIGFDINPVSRPVTTKELQELNYEDIVNVCDLLGMSDIYLKDNQNEHINQ